MSTTTVQTRTLTEIAGLWPGDFGWLRRQGVFADEDWDMETRFEVLSERDTTAVYVSDDACVVEINGQTEPHVVACDDDYAAMVRERVSRTGA